MDSFRDTEGISEKAARKNRNPATVTIVVLHQDRQFTAGLGVDLNRSDSGDPEAGALIGKGLGEEDGTAELTRHELMVIGHDFDKLDIIITVEVNDVEISNFRAIIGQLKFDGLGLNIGHEPARYQDRQKQYHSESC